MTSGTTGWQKENISYVAIRHFEVRTPESISLFCSVFGGNNWQDTIEFAESAPERRMKFYNVATKADQIMRGRRETQRESSADFDLTAFSAVFALERAWRDHKAAQNALNRMFFM